MVVRALLTLVPFAALVACGVGHKPPSPPEAAQAVVLSDLPSWGEAPASETLSTPEVITSLGSHGGALWIGTTSSLWRLPSGGQVLETVMVYGSDETWSDHGGTDGIFPTADGLLILGGGDAHESDGTVVVPSSVAAILADLAVRHLSVDPAGDLWLAAEEGLLRIGTDGLLAYDLPGATGGPTLVAATTKNLIVAYEDLLFEMSVESAAVSPGPSAGGLRHMARWGERVAVATDGGLLLFDLDQTWKLYPFDAGHGAQAASWVTADGDRLLVTTDEGILALVDDDGALGVAALVAGKSLAAGVAPAGDRDGHVWTATGTTATRWSVGSPLGFADVAGVFEAQCNSCHVLGIAGAPKRDFGSYDVVVSMIDPIMERIALGLMPPPGDGVWSGPLVPPSDIDLLVRWIDGGMNP